MSAYLVAVVAFLAVRYLVDLLADWLNVRQAPGEPPQEFADICDAEQYARSRRYLHDRTVFGSVVDTVHTAAVLLLILLGGFRFLDHAARAIGWSSEIATGLAFIGMLAFAGFVLQLPFDIHDTFVIEERYGFNKTTPRTFILDRLKGAALAIVLGGGAFSAVCWFFGKYGPAAWAYAWAAMTALQVVLFFIAPCVIMPLFNKFTPLEPGALREAIEDYLRRQRFLARGVFKMDGSRRSAKSNAFFTGFGRFRRIVLYDTLMEKHTVPEVLATVAHELGHCRGRHVPLALLRGIARTGLTLLILSQFLERRALFEAFQVSQPSVYAGLVFFGFLYTPIALVGAVLEGAVSRRHEYEADAFALHSTGDGEAMAGALKRLTVDSLSDLAPHPFKVWLHYSHPPVVDRIRRIRALAGSAARPRSE